MKKYDSAITLTERERSIILGSLLGDGYITRGRWKGIQANARVTFMQGEERLAYLQWKRDELSRWVLSPIDGPQTTQYGGQVYRFRTISHPLFTKIHEAIYPDGVKPKRITPQILSWLDDLALAVWFMDDGTSGYSDANIATYAFLRDDLEATAAHLTSRGINCRVMDTVKGAKLEINAAGRHNLYSAIAPHIHPALAYKLGTFEQRICVTCGKPFQARTLPGYRASPTACSRSCYVRMGKQNRRLRMNCGSSASM